MKVAQKQTSQDQGLSTSFLHNFTGEFDEKHPQNSTILVHNMQHKTKKNTLQRCCVTITDVRKSRSSQSRPQGTGRKVTGLLVVSWGTLPIMDYTGRLRPKGVPFSGWRYIKGQGFHEMKYRKRLGKLSFRYKKGLSKCLEQTHPTATSFLGLFPFEFIQVF